MKTLKLVMIATLVTFGMVSFGNVNVNANDVDSQLAGPTLKVVEISLEEALQIPGLVSAMRLQLDKDMIDPTVEKKIYTFDVVYLNYLVSITGHVEQWVLFFGSGFTKYRPAIT